MMYLRSALQEVRRGRHPTATADDPIFFRAEELREAVARQGGGPGTATDPSRTSSSSWTCSWRTQN